MRRCRASSAAPPAAAAASMAAPSNKCMRGVRAVRGEACPQTPCSEVIRRGARGSRAPKWLQTPRPKAARRRHRRQSAFAAPIRLFFNSAVCVNTKRTHSSSSSSAARKPTNSHSLSLTVHSRDRSAARRSGSFYRHVTGVWVPGTLLCSLSRTAERGFSKWRRKGGL